MYERINKGERITLEQVNTIADGIAVKSPGEKTFEIIDKYVDEIVTVTEGEIVDAFLLLSEKHNHKTLTKIKMTQQKSLIKKIIMK